MDYSNFLPIPWSRNSICSERILNSDVKSCVDFIYSIEYLRVYSHRESAMALALTLALTLVLTLGRNTLVSIVPFTPAISIRINISIKNQMGSGLIQKLGLGFICIGAKAKATSHLMGLWRIQLNLYIVQRQRSKKKFAFAFALI